jgi:hypothetical protein
MRLAPPTNRRRITSDATKTIAGALYLYRKPDRYDGDCHDDCAPHRRRNLFRTPASRGIIGGVVEFLIHRAGLRTKPLVVQNCAIATYRNAALTLSHSDAASRSPSCFDGAGCAALTGSDAGKLSIRPASSFAWVSRSAKAASRGSAACLSCGAGLNFSAMLSLHRQYNALAIQTFPTSELERH